MVKAKLYRQNLTEKHICTEEKGRKIINVALKVKVVNLG